MTEIARILSENLKRLRQSKGFTQESIAASAGLSLGGYQSIEYGRRWPNETSLGKVSKALGVPVTALFVADQVEVPVTLHQALQVLTQLARIPTPLLEALATANESEFTSIEAIFRARDQKLSLTKSRKKSS